MTILNNDEIIKKALLESGRNIVVELTEEELSVAFPRFYRLGLELDKVGYKHQSLGDGERFIVTNRIQDIIDKIEVAHTANDAITAMMEYLHEAREIAIVVFEATDSMYCSAEEFREFYDIMLGEFRSPIALAVAQWLTCDNISPLKQQRTGHMH